MTEAGDRFFLKEYERLHELWMHSLSRSEQRVTFFLTAISATLAVLFYVLGKDAALSSSSKLLAAELVLGLFLLFGFITLNRIVWGSEQRRVYYDRLMSEIRNKYAAIDRDVATYVEVERSLVESPRCRSRWGSRLLSYQRGRLTDFMIAINSVICGAMMAIAVRILHAGTPYQVLLGIVATLLGTFFMYRYFNAIRSRIPLQ